MISELIECEANNKDIYYKIVQLDSEYRDGNKFILDQILECNNKIDLKTNDRKNLGGFYISKYDFIFRWLIRGDTLCKVTIPEDSKVYKTISNNEIFLTNKMILTDPIKIDDNLATEMYKASNMPETSYYRALAACCIKGYINTSKLLVKERINKNNKEEAIKEFEDFCKSREEEYNINTFEV